MNFSNVAGFGKLDLCAGDAPMLAELRYLPGRFDDPPTTLRGVAGALAILVAIALVAGH